MCAHAWEARPFLEALDLKACKADYLPFPLYEGEQASLLLTGGGRARAAMAVGAWLSHRLRDLALASGAGLHAPTLVVANFGTAGANTEDWPIGQTLLIHRVQNGDGESHYPERLVAWSGEECQCRTVPTPQRESYKGGRGRTLFDMEAFGVAEAVTTFLSSAHLVVGKCVSDHLGVDPTEDWKALAQRCEDDYRHGAAQFLQHARDHLSALFDDQRREQAEWIRLAHERLLDLARAALPLTVTQQRDLAQHLRARLSDCQSAEERLSQTARLEALLVQQKAEGKAEGKKALARILQEFQAPDSRREGSPPTRGQSPNQ